MTRDLCSVRVIDAATNIAGPYCASILADLGADVIHVEPLGGDPMRAYPPPAGVTTTQFAAVNHGKRYLCLDLRRPEGRALLHRLVGDADVLVQNVRHGHESRLGLDAAACHRVNPRLVHVTLGAFYPADGDRPGYDMLIQGESGLLHLTGEPDRPPSRIGASAIDHVSGLWLAIGVMAALSGERDHATVRVSMLDVAIGLLNEKVSAHLMTGREPQRMGGGTTSTTPHGPFPTRDAYIVIGAATDETFQRLAGLLGPPVAGDPRFATQDERLAHRETLERMIAEALTSHGADHWVRELERVGVPVGRVLTLSEAVARHRNDSATGLRPIHGVPGLEVLAPPLSFGDDAWGPMEPPGAIGRDTDEILAEAGVSRAEVARLRDDGVIR